MFRNEYQIELKEKYIIKLKEKIIKKNNKIDHLEEKLNTIIEYNKKTQIMNEELIEQNNKTHKMNEELLKSNKSMEKSLIKANYKLDETTNIKNQRFLILVIELENKIFDFIF